jgi:putative ABC transport system permease protein
MLHATLKNLLSHKIRLALTALSVVLGVAFVAGTFIFTDTIDKSIDKLFDTIASDVTVTKRSEFSSDVATGTVPASLVDTVAAVSGVENAYGSVFVEGVQLIDPETNKAIGAQNGPPSFGTSWPDPNQTQYGAIRIVEGSPPRSSNQVVIDKSTADRSNLEIGDPVDVQTPGPRVSATISGIFAYENSDGLGSTTIVFDTPTAQQLLLEPGQFNSIEVTAGPGVTSEELTQRVQAAIPSDFVAKTAQQTEDEIRSDLDSFLNIFRTFLLVFASIALFVGIFIILNTFSMLVAQRTRELALLRAVGASRRQITRSVLVEALVVGLVGSTFGLLLGFGLAAGLRALMQAIGADFGDQAFVLEPRTILVSYVIGTLVTLLAAYLPARRAAKIPPMAALRDDVALPAAGLRRRVIIGTPLAVGGVLALAAGLAGQGGATLPLIGAGVAGLMIGIIVLTPLISRPVVSVLGKPFTKTHGAVGRLARGNAMRNPRRTAVTAAALMIGLSLIAALSVVGNSLKASVDKLFDNSVTAEYQVMNSVGGPFTPQIGDDLAKVSGVQHVTRMQFVPAKVDGQSIGGTTDTGMLGITPSGLGTALPITMLSGSTESLAAGQMLVNESTATSHHYTIGQQVNLTLPAGSRSVQIGGIFKDDDLLGRLILDSTVVKEVNQDNRDNLVLLNTDGNTSPALRSELDSVMEQFPTVQLQDKAEAKASNRSQINQLLAVLNALLALAVIIAGIGIINTLVLSVYERTREIGLLRAVGLGRRQLRTMIRLESVVISLFGALMGLVLGVGFGVAIQQAVDEDVFDVLSIPWGQLVLFVVAAALIGVLAALWPARRAAKLDVMQAITTE